MCLGEVNEKVEWYFWNFLGWYVKLEIVLSLYGFDCGVYVVDVMSFRYVGFSK